MKIKFLILLIAIVCSLPKTCSAQIIETTGSLIEVSPPATVSLNRTESNTEILAFFESRTSLPSELVVGVDSPGFYNEETDLQLPSPVISAGTTVDSFLLHFDPVRQTGGRRDGSITFGTDILGIIIESNALLASDSLLGSPTTFYPAPSQPFFELNGLEIESDSILLSSDRRTLTVSWFTNNLLDHVRILTVTATPEIGDVNKDGIVNFSDIFPFIAIVSVDGFQAEADINGDGIVDFLDISPFVELISL